MARVVGGFGFPKKYQGKQKLRYPFIKVNDMNLPGNEIYINYAENYVDEQILQEIKAKAYPSETIIFPKIGGVVATNKKRILNREATIDNNIMGVIPNNRSIYYIWIFYYFLTIDLMKLTKITTMPSIRKTIVEDIIIPFPPLEEQKRIISRIEELFGKIDETARLRKEAKEQAKALIRSAFHEVFSKVDNKAWRWAKLGDRDVAELNPSKKEIRDIPDDTRVSFIPMETVDEKKGEIVRSINRKLGEVRKGYTYFKEGDVIFAKITPCMENGKCAIAENLTNKLGFGSTEFHVVRPLNNLSSR